MMDDDDDVKWCKAKGLEFFYCHTDEHGNTTYRRGVDYIDYRDCWEEIENGEECFEIICPEPQEKWYTLKPLEDCFNDDIDPGQCVTVRVTGTVWLNCDTMDVIWCDCFVEEDEEFDCGTVIETECVDPDGDPDGCPCGEET